MRFMIYYRTDESGWVNHFWREAPRTPNSSWLKVLIEEVELNTELEAMELCDAANTLSDALLTLLINDKWKLPT